MSDRPYKTLESDTQFRYTPDPGVVPEGTDVLCGLCGSVMDEKRGVLGPRNWSESVAKHKSLHDVFTCPHSKSDWHRQVHRLRLEANKTPSGKLSTMLYEEAAEILRTRTATVKVGILW